ncbi:hypothetical protein Dimus_012194 [Dionaea muscipula]
MAPSPSSLFLLLLRLPKSPKLNYFPSHFRRHLSLSSPLRSNPNPTISDPSQPPSLSSRLSFVFEHIDKIEKERAEKDEALQRIKAWRESKKYRQIAGDGGEESESAGNAELGLGINASGVDNFSEDRVEEGLGRGEGGGGLMKREIELAHPWPEWVELMERLVQQNYFDLRRKNEDKMIENLGGDFSLSDVVEEGLGLDFTRDFKTVQTAVLNFGKDRFDILRSLSRQDIQVLVGYGCPSADKKVVFSAKLLRKLAHLDEGDVCSTCSLRTSCEKAYLLTHKEDEARTIDVMRVLLTYGFDPINGSVANKSLLKQKSVKTVVRKLLHEIVKLSSVPIDPNLPPPVIMKRPPKVKQPPPPPKKRVGRDDIEMKKGDWLCTKCDFMNFAKNLICLQCDAKRPKRQLLPGEWECPQCNFLNYRRNLSCFHCECKRPPDEYTENQMQERQRKPIMRSESRISRQEVSNAWNFDFDDDESDGADVATFEHADSHGVVDSNPLGNDVENPNLHGPEDNFHYTSRMSLIQGQDGGYSSDARRKLGTGFDDFDDEDDDIESYEIDDQSRNQRRDSSSVRFSDVESYSDSSGETETDLNGYRYSSKGSSSRSSYNMASGQLLHRKGGLSGSQMPPIDSDDDVVVQPTPTWKFSHDADSRQRRDRGSCRRPLKGSSSDEDDLGLASGSGDDLDGNFMGRQEGGRSNRNTGGRSFGSDSCDDLDVRSHGNSRGHNGGWQSRRGGGGSNGIGRPDRNNDFDRPSPPRGSYGNRRGSTSDDFEVQRRSGRGRDRQNFRGGNSGASMSNEYGHGEQRSRRPRDTQGGFSGSRQQGTSNNRRHRRTTTDGNWSDMDMDRDLDHRRPRRQQRVNVR